ncbi:hypothetical protein ACFP3I_10730 [Chryseobacterium arachidis]
MKIFVCPKPILPIDRFTWEQDVGSVSKVWEKIKIVTLWNVK